MECRRHPEFDLKLKGSLFTWAALSNVTSFVNVLDFSRLENVTYSRRTDSSFAAKPPNCKSSCQTRTQVQATARVMDKGSVTSTDCHWDRWSDNIVSFAGCFLGSNRNYKIHSYWIYCAMCCVYLLEQRNAFRQDLSLSRDRFIKMQIRWGAFFPLWDRRIYVNINNSWITCHLQLWFTVWIICAFTWKGPTDMGSDTFMLI